MDISYLLTPAGTSVQYWEPQKAEWGSRSYIDCLGLHTTFKAPVFSALKLLWCLKFSPRACPHSAEQMGTTSNLCSHQDLQTPAFVHPCASNASAICGKCYQGHMRINQPTLVRDMTEAEHSQGKGWSHKHASGKPPSCFRSRTGQISLSFFLLHQVDSDSQVMHHQETVTGFHIGQEGIFLMSTD